MSTRGRVGLLLKNGEVISIYNHWDSYPSRLGKVLMENYKNIKKVKRLIALGDCSSIRELVDIPKGKIHTFDNPLDNVTVAYHRDRGRKVAYEAFVDVDEEEYWKYKNDYVYLFKDGKWYVKCSYSKSNKVWELTTDIIEDKIDIIGEENYLI